MFIKISTLILLFLLVIPSYSKSINNSLRECINNDTVLHFSFDSSYQPTLEFTIQNLRVFLNHSNPKLALPFAIITPLEYSHVQSAIRCSKKLGLQIRIRSGGHDHEGMSYTNSAQYYAASPFVLIDLVNLTRVDVNLSKKTAWIQSGASIGQVYYWVNHVTQDYSFSGGICPTVGVGGLITGGGIGYMSRKYGLSIDSVVDALIIDVDGEILNRRLMGEDLFWAIRGGGAASYGVIVAWNVQLVPIPRIVTVFNVSRNHEQGGVDLIHKSQLTCYHTMNESLRMRLEISTINGKTQVTFSSIYLGSARELLLAINESFPELNMTENDCKEMSFLDAIMYFYYPKHEPEESLRDKIQTLPKFHFKSKSDFVSESEPLTKTVIEEIWKRCSESENIHFITHAYGGRINSVAENQTPFPFRQGTLYDIEYCMEWEEDDMVTAGKNMDWVRNLYDFMTPYVMKNPRGAYSNFRDFDLGINKNYNNKDGSLILSSLYENARKWGEMYFKNNFRRLAEIKGRVDQENYFALERTVPPLKPIR